MGPRRNSEPSLLVSLLIAAVFAGIAGLAAQPPSIEKTHASTASDIPKQFTAPENGYDYTKREVMIPMRDGVKLHTVIVVPKGAANAPILLTRTPYNASKRASRNNSSHMLSILPAGDEVFVAAGYIRVFQDVRGKYGSEGDYLMTRPVIGPLNHTRVDHVTDRVQEEYFPAKTPDR